VKAIEIPRQLAYNDLGTTDMAKTLLVLLLIAGAAFFIYKQTNRTDSEELAMVDSIRERYAVVVNKFLSAAGRSGAIGMDTTYDSETAVTQVLKLRAELAKLRETLTEERAIGKADALAEKIEYFCKKNDIIRP
jgi:preprotein translocase subunit YajC